MRAFFLIVLVALASCGEPASQGDKPSPTPETPSHPAPPAAASLALDLSFRAPAGGLNHATAAALLADLDAKLTVPLATAARILAGAAAAPVVSGTTGDLRSFDVPDGNRVFTANLSETPRATGGAAWSATVTAKPLDVNGCCDAFELLSGTATDVAGTWSLFDLTSPATKSVLATVAFDPTTQLLAWSDQHATVRHAGNTVSITLGDATISWNAATQAGKLTQNAHDSCWDAAAAGFADTDCGLVSAASGP
jgi:hypothetical protein